MNKKLKYQTQSVLIPRNKFKDVHEAAKYVQSLGFKPDVKKPHITDQFYRFRQLPPQKNADYQTHEMDRGVKTIVMHPPNYHQRVNQTILGKDGKGTLKPEYRKGLIPT